MQLKSLCSLHQHSHGGVVVVKGKSSKVHLYLQEKSKKRFLVHSFVLPQISILCHIICKIWAVLVVAVAGRIR